MSNRVPGGIFEHLNSGDKFRIRAETYNALMEMAAEYYSTRKQGAPRPPAVPGPPENSVSVLVKNTTGGNLPQFAVLGVGTPLVLPSASEPTFRQRHAYNGITPAAGQPFVIIQEPLGVNAIGTAIIAGETAVKLNVTSATDGWAGPSSDPQQLTTGSFGPARILWKDSGTGSSIWGRVLLTGDDDDGGSGDCCEGFLGSVCTCDPAGGSCSCGGGVMGIPSTLMPDCCYILGGPGLGGGGGTGGGTPPPVPGPVGGTTCCRARLLWCCGDPSLGNSNSLWFLFNVCWNPLNPSATATVTYLGVEPAGPAYTCGAGNYTVLFECAGTTPNVTAQMLAAIPGGPASYCGPAVVQAQAGGGGIGGGQCRPGQIWLAGVGCVNHCPDGFYYDATSQTCQPIPNYGGPGGTGGLFSDLLRKPLGGAGLGGVDPHDAMDVSQISSATAGIVQVPTAGGAASIIALDGNAAHFLDGTGAFSPAGGGSAAQLVGTPSDLLAQTATQTVATYTVGGSNEVVRVSANVVVTATGIGGNVTPDVNFTDTHGTAQTIHLYLGAGTGQVNQVGAFPLPSIQVRAKNGTNVTITYTVGGTITWDGGGTPEKVR